MQSGHRAAIQAQNNLDSLMTDDDHPSFHQCLQQLNTCPSLSQLSRKYLTSLICDLREKIQNPNSPKATMLYDLNPDQEELILAKACVAFCACLLSQCTQLGFSINDTKKYWRSVQGDRISLLIQKGPFYWIRQLIQGSYHGPEKDLQYTLEALERIECMNARLVGHLVRSLAAFAQIQKLDSQLMPLVHQFMQSMKPLLYGSSSNSTDVPPSPTQHASALNAPAQNEVGSNLSDNNDELVISSRGTSRLNAERRRTLLELTQNLDQYVKHVTRFHIHEIQDCLYLYQTPGHFARHWVKYSVAVIAAFFATRYVYQHIDEVNSWAINARDAAIRFYHNNVENPLKNMYSVIRYDRHQQLLDPVSLESSVHSLQNMMTDYAMENYKLDSSQLEKIRVQAQRGDLSLIMSEYERELKNPIRNVIFGDMARLMLVQLQKQKVDLERTLVAMDKLLRSNEINFELIALIPAVLVSLIAVYNILTFRRVQDRRLYQQMRYMLLAVEKILNANNNRAREALSDESQGLVYMYVYRMGNLMQHKYTLLNISEERYDFYEDLKEVDSDEMEIQQRLNTVQRMFRCYSFLALTQDK